MKTIAALGAALMIAAAAALWLTTGPVLVRQEVRPLQPNASMPLFRPVPQN